MQTYVNLLPTRTAVATLLLRRVRQWSFVALSALSLVVVGSIVEWKRVESIQVRLKQLENQAGPLPTLEREVDHMQQQLDQCNARATLAAQLVDDRSMLSLIGLVSRAAHESAGKVCVRQLSVETVSASGQRGLGVTGNVSLRKLQLEGLGEDNLSVARFVAALRESRAFHEVQLKASESTQKNDRKFRNYQLECIF